MENTYNELSLISALGNGGNQMLKVNLDNSELDKILDTKHLPLLPLRNTVLFPGVLIPINVVRQKSVKLINDAFQAGRYIGIVAQINSNTDNPNFDDLYKTGTIAKVVQLQKMPDNSISVIIQGVKRFVIENLITDEPYFMVNAIQLSEQLPKNDSPELQNLMQKVKEVSLNMIQLSVNVPQEVVHAIKSINNPLFLVNYVGANSGMGVVEKQQLLEIQNFTDRIHRLIELLSIELQKLEVQGNIQQKVKAELNQRQKEFFLNEQLKTIRTELGGDALSEEIEALKEKAKTKKWNENIAKTFAKEIQKLERMHPAGPEYSHQTNYLQTLLELPWNIYTTDNFDLKRAQKILESDHFGLEQVKDRILEHLAVLKLKGDLKAPILCLVGPPGVGKTSLGKSIAKALKRKYVRMSLGGLHDEAEIRGHRKTYIGAMPGRIIQNLKKVKSSNPVFILDEIDKVGNDFRGDPSFALLEVLDPEQNDSFYDNYLELEYDLSKVLFVATANSLNTVKPALRDRMEIINVTGYIVEEKVEIAKRHLIPKQLEAHGVTKNQLKFSKAVIEQIVESYSRESGVRQLDKKIAQVVRHIAKRIGMDEQYDTNLNATDIETILGPPDFLRDKYEGNDFAGVVTGLAWTAFGGEILFIETSLSLGNGKLTLTGNLGNVMKESATIAVEYIKAHANELKIKPEVFNKWNIHIHIPEGAIPKDGPSAGITMVTSLASAFTQRKVKNQLAMTGEITLRGKVLAVGGIKEKILAAKRANIKEIILSSDNKKDIAKIKDIYLEGLTITYVDTIMEVINKSLLKQKVAKALKM